MESKKQTDTTFNPYIPASDSPPELTIPVIILGIILAVLFGAANAYLGLKAGMTVSASIPAAVISMCVFRFLLKRSSILENNMVQTIGSAGESLASGIIFTVPALFMWAKEWGTAEPSLLEITAIAFCGGMLGLCLMAPLRNALIVKEHTTLLYPEGRACANILIAGQMGGAEAMKIFHALGISSLYTFCSDALHLFKGEIETSLSFLKGAGLGCNIMPALFSVGFIIGRRVASIIFAGSLLSWLVLMPLIAFFGGDAIVNPAAKPISELDMWGIWSNYIRYIGAGALSTSGIIGLIKIIPLLYKTLKETLSNISIGKEISRTAQELSLKHAIAGCLASLLLLYLLPFVHIDFLGVILITIFGFIFAAVTARIVGIVGASNNPASGMTIATLLFVSFAYLATGHMGKNTMVMVLMVGAVVCCISTLCSDVTQDLKTGYLLGATPFKQQIGEIIGIAASSLAVGAIISLLDAAWGFGSKELAAPQAMIMKTLIEGIMTQHLPWALVFIGMGCSIVAELLGIGGLSFAIGMYLPVHTNMPIFIGSILRYYLEHNAKNQEDIENDKDIVNGTLVASGFIAGEGVVGIIVALLTVLGISLDLSGLISLGTIGSLICFLLLILSFIWLTKK